MSSSALKLTFPLFLLYFVFGPVHTSYITFFTYYFYVLQYLSTRSACFIYHSFSVSLFFLFFFSHYKAIYNVFLIPFFYLILTFPLISFLCTFRSFFVGKLSFQHTIRADWIFAWIFSHTNKEACPMPGIFQVFFPWIETKYHVTSTIIVAASWFIFLTPSFHF